MGADVMRTVLEKDLSVLLYLGLLKQQHTEEDKISRGKFQLQFRLTV